MSSITTELINITTILEQTRQLHAQRDKLLRSSVELMLSSGKANNHQQRLLGEHQLHKMLQRILEVSNQLSGIYADISGTREKEIQSHTSEELTAFYSKLKAIKDHYRRQGDVLMDEEELVEDVDNDDDDLTALFSGEESLGRYLDLHLQFQQYINLKGITKITYLAYLDHFDKFDVIEDALKKRTEYREYIKSLHSYLHSFFTRAKPLFNINQLLEEAKNEFEEKWENNHGKHGANTAEDGPNELFCVACQKQFTNPNVYKSHLTGKKHKKAMEQTQNNNAAHQNKDNRTPQSTLKATLLLEYQIEQMADILQSVREDTRTNIERKSSLTTYELLEEMDEYDEYEGGGGQGDQAGEEDEEEDKEDDEKIYNPLNLPLGWDGKPIPYWLYKLHGLGVSYSCEICGNYVYMGRKAFEKHFMEYRHSYGLKCLGIPNTKHFMDVTSIEDAKKLWEKLQAEGVGAGAAGTGNGADVEEFEDAYGNVYNKKTYEDLKRQGLI